MRCLGLANGFVAYKPDWMSKLSGPTGWMSRLKIWHLLDVPTGCPHRMSLLNVPDRMSLLDVPTGCPDWMSKLSGPTGWMSRLKSCHLLDVPTGCLHRMSLLNVFDRMSSTGCPYWMSRLDVQTQWANWMDVPTKGLSLTGCPYWMSPTSRYFQEFEMGGGGYRQKFWGGV